MSQGADLVENNFAQGILKILFEGERNTSSAAM